MARGSGFLIVYILGYVILNILILKVNLCRKI